MHEMRPNTRETNASAESGGGAQAFSSEAELMKWLGGLCESLGLGAPPDTPQSLEVDTQDGVTVQRTRPTAIQEHWTQGQVDEAQKLLLQRAKMQVETLDDLYTFCRGLLVDDELPGDTPVKVLTATSLDSTGLRTMGGDCFVGDVVLGRVMLVGLPC